MSTFTVKGSDLTAMVKFLRDQKLKGEFTMDACIGFGQPTWRVSSGTVIGIEKTATIALVEINFDEPEDAMVFKLAFGDLIIHETDVEEG